MENGMAYQDIAQADFFHITQIFNEQNKKETPKTMFEAFGNLK